MGLPYAVIQIADRGAVIGVYAFANP
jgi:hypothetical protein